MFSFRIRGKVTALKGMKIGEASGDDVMAEDLLNKKGEIVLQKLAKLLAKFSKS